MTQVGNTIGITTKSSLGGNITMSIDYDYHYKVGNQTYRGLYSISKESNEKRLRCPKYKYLVIYSKKNPAYHILIPREVTKDNYKEIKISDDVIKDKFIWLNDKARVVKQN
ncbi:hypothetical protein [Saccharicrinis aurantiacus]|uniref:hypothetical protein n=1 Tax=Saccharicrinis aurantiacus TaxID=1849719 RepID=UPI002491B1BB|nr:hypothetical protein [Saccharicrinis aurantiacus]